MVIVFLLGALYSNPGYSQETYKFLLEWGLKGSGVGEFIFPQSVATDPLGNVYVADHVNKRIQKFDSNGNFISIFDFGAMNVSGIANIPYGLSADSTGNVYAVISVVATTSPGPPSASYIYKFDSNGNFISRWGISGIIEFGPRGVAVDPLGNVYVVDTGNHWIQKFDSNGNLLIQWGSNGSGDSQFNYPGGVTIDQSGNIYVADTGNHRIQKFDSNGTFLTKWGFSPDYNWPSGVAVDLSGDVYVLLLGVEKFESNGDFITEWGSEGNGDGQFNHPRGLAVDQSGNIYVADTFNHRIQKFSRVLPPVILKSPPIGKNFNACSSSSPPILTWEVSGTFNGYRIEFSPDRNFESIPFELAVLPSDTQTTIPLDVWDEIMANPWTSGITTYWRVVGTKPDEAIETSSIRSFTTGAEPVGYPGIVPTIRRVRPNVGWTTNCNTRFRVWFGSNRNFSKKTYSFEIENPSGNEGWFSMTLTSQQWSRIKLLVNNKARSTIYWYIESWDDFERYARTNVMSFSFEYSPCVTMSGI